MQIEHKLLSELKPATYNPRQISTKQYNDLKTSIEKFGMVDPIVVNKDMTIIGGHQRYKIFRDITKKNSLPNITIPCVVLELNKEQERELNIRLNKNTGDFDMDILANEFDIDELVDWGFKHIDLDINIDKIVEGNTEDDHIPEVKESRVKLGDVWQLGNHRLMCGDSTKESDVKKLMNGQKADMVFTDPPYGVNYTGGLKDGENGLEQNNRQGIKNDDLDLYYQAVSIANKFSNGVVFMFYADTVPFGLYRGIEDINGEIVALIIWKKRGGYGALGASYKPNHEPCLIWKPKGTRTNFIGSTTENRVWEIDKEGVNKLHPTQKPIELCVRAIKNHQAEIVLDLFLGSGSTLIACEKTNRICYGMELDTKYCDVIIERWQQFTNQKAIKCGV
jgi:DNA modification methylase